MIGSRWILSNITYSIPTVDSRKYRVMVTVNIDQNGGYSNCGMWIIRIWEILIGLGVLVRTAFLCACFLRSCPLFHTQKKEPLLCTCVIIKWE